MHLFISMMCSLLVITGLQVSVESTGIRSKRNDDRTYISTLTVRNGGAWGTWGERKMCPTGTYAAGFDIKVEGSVGSGDDTALNGIRLICVAPSQGSNSNQKYSVESTVGGWGQWKGNKWCPSSEFFTRFMLRVERPQDFFDDTAANNIYFQCSGGSSMMGDGTNWGGWGDLSQTCDGKGICGIQTKVEGWQRDGDDTALNDVRMFCCS